MKTDKSDDKQLPLYIAKEDESFYGRHRKWFHLVFWTIMTGYFIAAMVLHSEKGPIVLPMLYAFITFKLLFAHVSTKYVTGPIGAVWGLVTKPIMALPTRVRNILGVLIPLVVMLSVVLVTPDSEAGTRIQRLTSMLGLFTFIFLLYITSNDRAAVNWRTVIVGVSMQFLLGLFILKTQIGYEMFSYVSHMASTFLEFSKEGAKFVFGQDITKWQNFAVAVLPGVLFFASFIQIVYYLGAMQWVIKKFAWLMVRLMDTSGSESVVAAASPFVGQGESALLVKPFIEDMTLSEIHSTMTSGFATIAGSVLIAFIALGINSQALITACVMSTPCSLAVSKLRYPETQESLTKGKVHIPVDEDRESNALHAAANGAAQGVHLIALIVGTLIAVISLLALVDALLGFFGSFLGFTNLTLVSIVRYVFVPLTWLIGIPAQDVLQVSELYATKMFVNEFVAYIGLSKMPELALRTQLLTTFALCGFANFASIGVQIGCIGAMAPSRKGDLAKLAFSAMICGTASTFMTATIAGMLL
jgi:CNT family concentrative nucleoside transporter